MTELKHEWLIEPRTNISGRKRWYLMHRIVEIDGQPHAGKWDVLSWYPTRKQAVTVGMIMRERGERISWPGGPLKMGIATVEPCELTQP